MEPVTALSPLALKSDHLALVAGLPCSTTYFALELCRDLLSRKYGACEVIFLNDLCEATLEQIAAAEHPVVFLSEIPDAAVAEVIGRSRFPVLMIDQSFAGACEDFIAARDANVLDTIRTMARAQVGLDELLAIPRSTLVAADMHQPAADLTARIAMLCDIDPVFTQAMIDERNLGRPLIDVLAAHFTHARPEFANDVTDLLGQLDQFYGFHPKRRHPNWGIPIDLLLEAAPPYSSAKSPISLLGPARCLSFGPYLYLPAGRWRADFTFIALDNKSSNALGFDIVADKEIKLEENFELNLSGTFFIVCEFKIESPYSPLEFRTYLRRGSIGGEFRIVSLTLTTIS